ncbi:uncharacterized protein LOC117111896 [Anneissia japonica]|uniref:uncharacterized protein LOC117111896 n=1 Tax=Anneissia japonica TaxID=1529436 RepID=UPI0014257A33|nr:uncharacterized protein LOC117111896 [Anneissia japonica]
MGRRKRNKSSSKRKPKLMFTDSPCKEPMKVLCSPVYNAEHPVEADKILVHDINNLPWVSPQFDQLHFTQKNKSRRKKKVENQDESNVVDKPLTIPKRLGRLQFENEDRVRVNKQLGNNQQIGLELTFKKRRRKKMLKGDLSDDSDIELSDQENLLDTKDKSSHNIEEYLDITDTKLNDNHETVLAFDTPVRDYGVHVHIRRRRDMLPPCARQKLMDAIQYK